MSQDAVGTCRSCGKGLSLEYAVDLGKGLACKGKCEEDVRLLIDLIERNLRLITPSETLILANKKSGYIGGGFLMISGAIFIIFGSISEMNIFLISLGAVFFAYGVFAFFQRWSINRKMRK
ncbi:hypothetical protein CH373_03315 [Leptospira perolatii]|uniref:Uncharacterized protein n=2 Tax=Leptospira perolatii TaxID=2023191 RepID=A0A2M9ZSK8_9LEPT|nr:hypothetical protein CH360_03310 [Leptospira perolatii]PJZ75060.1 hypothetical protein CH373_03315 [Leptospira perolatii]